MSDKIKYGIQTVAPAAAQGRLKEAYAQMTHDLTGVHEPFLVHSAAEDVLLGLWSAYREALLANGTVSRALKETITVAVSEINRCPWCYEAHQISLHAVGASAAAAAITRPGAPARLDDQSAAMIAWARATRTPGAAILREPPFSPAEAPEILGTAVVYHYLTRVVNALLVESALPRQRWLKAPVIRLAARFFAPYARQAIPQGATLTFLPDAPLPPDFAWAQGSPRIAGAFARFAAVIEAAGARSVPAEVRQLVETRLSTWCGEDPGLSRRWVEDAVQPLDAALRPSARLALLGALAPHQIDEGVIGAFCESVPGDRALVETLAWASFTAARRVGSWLWNARPAAMG